MNEIAILRKDVDELKEIGKTIQEQAIVNHKQSEANEQAIKDLKDALDPIIDLLAVVQRIANGIITASKVAKICMPILIFLSMLWVAYTAIKSGTIPNFTGIKIGD